VTARLRSSLLKRGILQQHFSYEMTTEFVQFGNTNDRPRSGRPRVTTARQDRLMRLTHLRNRTRTAVELLPVELYLGEA
jgi:hypothetical protein